MMPDPEKNRTIGKVELIAAAFIACIAIAGGIASKIGDSLTKEKQARHPILTISSSKLADKYKSNEINADANFRGQCITVEGEVSKVATDVGGRRYVDIGTGLFSDVTCYFDQADSGELVRLAAGQKVSISGICQGKSILLTMDHCWIDPK